MHEFKKLQLLLVPHLLILQILFAVSIALLPSTATTLCGKIPIQSPFFSTENLSLFNGMLLCKAEKLYFRTSRGLFPVSSIDYHSKLLTISQPTCSSSLHYVSPSVLSAGFPSPPQANSILLFNCTNKQHLMFPFIRDCTRLHNCRNSGIQQKSLQGLSSCVLVDDLDKLDMGFDPKDLNCSHYSRVYRNSSQDYDLKGYELGTRISFDIPDHVPNICDECKKPNGNCGVGLRCICNRTECKDKVISKAGSMFPYVVTGKWEWVANRCNKCG